MCSNTYLNGASWDCNVSTKKLATTFLTQSKLFSIGILLI